MKCGAVLSFLSALFSGLGAAIWPGMINQFMDAGSGKAEDRCRVLLHTGMYAALGDTPLMSE
jgi:hypothetical protein